VANYIFYNIRAKFHKACKLFFLAMVVKIRFVLTLNRLAFLEKVKNTESKCSYLYYFSVQLLCS